MQNSLVRNTSVTVLLLLFLCVAPISRSVAQLAGITATLKTPGT